MTKSNISIGAPDFDESRSPLKAHRGTIARNSCSYRSLVFSCMYLCMYVMYVCMYVCMHVMYVHHVCIYACMHAGMYACRYVGM